MLLSAVVYRRRSPASSGSRMATTLARLLAGRLMFVCPWFGGRVAVSCLFLVERSFVFVGAAA